MYRYRKEVFHTDNKLGTRRPAGLRPTPPRLTRVELQALGRTRVTLTTAELEQLAQLVAAGQVLLRDGRSISRNLRAAMTKMGVNAKGL
jgi:hypothetical protein